MTSFGKYIVNPSKDLNTAISSHYKSTVRTAVGANRNRRQNMRIGLCKLMKTTVAITTRQGKIFPVPPAPPLRWRSCMLGSRNVHDLEREGVPSTPVNSYTRWAKVNHRCDCQLLQAASPCCRKDEGSITTHQADKCALSR